MKKYLMLAALVVLTGCLATKTGVVTQTPQGPVTNQVYAATPLVGQIQGGAQAISPYIPPPYNILLTALAGLLGTGVASYVAVRNGKTANTIIEGVEAAGTAGAAVKKSIADTSLANGNSDVVNARVQKVTA